MSKPICNAKPAATVYSYEPVGLDLYSEHSVEIPAGTLVRKVQPWGCPKNGTMGFTYVETLEGVFAGLRLVNSLERVKRTRVSRVA